LVQQLVNMPDQQAQKYISQLSPESQPIVLQALREAKNQQYQGAGYQEAQKIAMQLMNVGEQERQAIMSKLPGALKDKVVSMMQELQAQQKEDDSKKIDMRPLPDQKPPRRDSLK
jgi:vacuolar-type H+-ATPase subunit H